MNSEQFRQKIEHQFQEIETIRDDIRVQLHLAKLSMRDELEELEERWSHFATEIGRLKQLTATEATLLQDKLNIIAEELESAYRRIHRRMSEEEEQ